MRSEAEVMGKLMSDVMSTTTSEKKSKEQEHEQQSVFNTNRQAIVVIHGVGNQIPMDTLRSFTDTVLDCDADAGESKYYSKPENISQTFELRRLQSHDSRPRSDFFELYWQHLVPTATWSKIYSWLVLLLKRKPGDVPPSIRTLWITTWVLLIAIILLMIATGVLALFSSGDVATNTPASPPVSPLLTFGSAAILAVIESLILNYVGDAAIYLSPTPDNIKARQEVRQAGVSLIQKLHEGLDEDHVYDRIVIVGHSLGSVIGYDILTYSWPLFNERHNKPARPNNDAVDAAEKAAQALWESTKKKTKPSERKAAREHWQSCSRKLWHEQRQNGFPWLVTDFITLGSPLTHAMILLARNSKEFERKKAQSELPTCPPLLDQNNGFSYRLHYNLDDNSKRTVMGLNHSALFAVTRWSNLYFPAKYLLKGDYISGPLVKAFGPGITDLSVKTAALNGWLSHTQYWHPHRSDKDKKNASVTRLKQVLDLKRYTFGGK